MKHLVALKYPPCRWIPQHLLLVPGDKGRLLGLVKKSGALHQRKLRGMYFNRTYFSKEQDKLINALSNHEEENPARCTQMDSQESALGSWWDFAVPCTCTISHGEAVPQCCLQCAELIHTTGNRPFQGFWACGELYDVHVAVLCPTPFMYLTLHSLKALVVSKTPRCRL